MENLKHCLLQQFGLVYAGAQNGLPASFADDASATVRNGVQSDHSVADPPMDHNRLPVFSVTDALAQVDPEDENADSKIDIVSMCSPLLSMKTSRVCRRDAACFVNNSAILACNPNGVLVVDMASVSFISAADGAVSSLGRLPDGRGTPTVALLSDDASYAAIGFDSGSVTVVNVVTGARVWLRELHDDAVTGLVFVGQQLCCSGADGKICFRYAIDNEGDEFALTLDISDDCGGVYALCMGRTSDDGEMSVIAGGASGEVFEISTTTHRVLRKQLVSNVIITALHSSAEQDHVVVGTASRPAFDNRSHLVLVNKDTLKGDPHLLLGPRGDILTLSCDGTGTYVVAGSADGYYYVWDTRQSTMKELLLMHTVLETFSFDGNCLARVGDTTPGGMRAVMCGDKIVTNKNNVLSAWTLCSL